jgi:dTDP-4-amino-4,6-dideoxygalactose transaminase
LDFPTHKVCGLRKKIGHAGFRRLEKELSSQRERAACYIEKLKGIKGIKIITEAAQAKASYPYLTLLFDAPDKRQKALEVFRGSGLGASLIYLQAITDYDYLKEIVGNKTCPNARSIAQRHLTLTTSCFLKEKEINRALELIERL